MVQRAEERERARGQTRQNFSLLLKRLYICSYMRMCRSMWVWVCKYVCVCECVLQFRCSSACLPCLCLVPLWQPRSSFKPFICWRHFVVPHFSHTHTQLHPHTRWQKTSALSLSHWICIFRASSILRIHRLICMRFILGSLFVVHSHTHSRTHTPHTHTKSRLLWVPFWHIPTFPSLFITLRNWQLSGTGFVLVTKLNTAKFWYISKCSSSRVTYFNVDIYVRPLKSKSRGGWGTGRGSTSVLHANWY